MPNGSIPVAHIVRARAGALSRQFHNNVLPPIVQAADPWAMVRLPSHGGGRIDPLGQFSRDRAVIWRKATPNESSVWVRSSMGNYRDAYKRFLEVVYAGSDIDFKEINGFHIDHLLNRANAKPSDYLRIEAINGGINQQHGASFERRNSRSTINISHRDREQSLMTFIMMLKIAGLAAPTNESDTARLEAIHRYFEANAWPKAEIEDAVKNLLLKSQWRR